MVFRIGLNLSAIPYRLFIRRLMSSAELLSPTVKKQKLDMKIGTHSGTFHCDEALACFMLKQLPEYKTADIVRSRNSEVLSACDILVDVGGVYDPQTHRYDHHQRTFNSSMNSLCAANKWTTKLSSAGLVYYHFGERILKQMVGSEADDHTVKSLYDKVYDGFIEEIDAIDNGINIADGEQRYTISTCISSRVSRLNPSWNDPEPTTDEKLDKLFQKAMALVGTEFTDRVQFYSQVWWPARKLVEDALKKRYEVDSSGEIICLSPEVCPWKDHLIELEEELKIEPKIKFVLYTDTSGMWRVQCVPANKSSFANRLSILEKWCGLRDEELSKVSGIDGCTFVHASGFIGGNKTKQGVLEMARKTLLGC